MNPKMKYLFCCLACCLVWPWGACKQSYTPPALDTNPNLLVVDGVLNAGAGGVTTINLSRTLKIGDSLGAYIPELNDKLVIQGDGGDTYALTEQGNGTYLSAAITLNPVKKYRLQITTSKGVQYLSDYVPVQISPPIDSVSWKQENRDVNIYLTTHDPANQSHYYRWDYVETWEYHSPLQSILAVVNHRIYYTTFIDSSKQTRVCWESQNSPNISLATSVGLSQDVINLTPITTIVNGSSKLSARYSILVNEYVLTPTAYQYWSIIQKNTQLMGSLFDPQPSQLVGNIHRVNSPEPVIGYLSASSVQQRRIYIDNGQLNDWDTVAIACQLKTVGQNPSDFADYPYDNPTFPYYEPEYLPYYFVTGGIVLARKACVDCLLRGGTNQKPSYWIP